MLQELINKTNTDFTPLAYQNKPDIFANSVDPDEMAQWWNSPLQKLRDEMAESCAILKIHLIM